VTVSEYLMKPGSFTVNLARSLPYRLWTAIRELDHVVITPARLDPISDHSDANILSTAIYTGVILAKPSPTSISGQGLAWWLGTDDGRGDLLTTAVTNTAGALSTWITSLRPSSLSAGTVTDSGTTTLTYTYQWMSRREALAHMCRQVGAEWRINPNLKLDAATEANLFVTTPTTVITRQPEGRDAVYLGLEAVDIGLSRDVDGYTTAITVVGRSGDQDIAALATATGSNVYVDGNNNNVVLRRLANAPTETASTVSAYATALLALYSSLRRSVTLSSRSYAIPASVRPGDYVYVFDPEADMTDTANQITWRGEVVAPVKLRCKGYTWPIQQGMGVYVRRSGSTPVYTDITDHVEWEGDTTTWEVGTSVADAEQDPTQLGAAFLGVNPEVAGRMAPAGVRCLKRLAADVINNNASANTIADVTGLSFPVVSGKRYWFRFFCHYTAAATSTGSRWAINGPTVSEGYWRSEYSLTTTSRTVNDAVIAYDTPAACNATSAGGVFGGNIAIIEGEIVPSADGTVIARFASQVSSSAITCKVGSYVEWMELP